MSETFSTGGCQCGAVRFRAYGLKNPSICHCRMCQKAFAAPFGALVGVERVEWLWAEPKRFRSSNKISRGFCAECGTPLTYEFTGGIDLAICAFDDPTTIIPSVQLSAETRLVWCKSVETLPERSPELQQLASEAQSGLVSFQHPDHEKPDWNPRA